MIIVRSPLRISIGGGGTDLPSYYQKHGGFLIAGAIDKYVYTTLNETYQKEFLLRYSRLENLKDPAQIQHPIIREVLKLCGHTKPPYLEITSLADIPAGTGLGSSGSFTTALLKAMHTYKREQIAPRKLAEMACHIEIDLLKEPIGKQDQYISVFGGLTCFEFEPDGYVKISPAQVSNDTIYILEDNLMMFFTGYARRASEILKHQDQRLRDSEESMVENLHVIKEIGYKIKDALEKSQPDEFGRLMHQHWMHKRKRAADMSNQHIDELYDLAMKNGALGGKLIGAGGGGFLLFYCENSRALRKAMHTVGLSEVRFRFDFEGTKVLF
jgi:D-glycero-alpha-D-manno-heptose-7-phosphate kinase